MADGFWEDEIDLALSNDLTPTSAYMSIGARSGSGAETSQGHQYMSESLARGLRNVVMDTTQSSFIDGEEGILCLLYTSPSPRD